MGRKTSVYLSDGLSDRVKASGVPLAVLVERGLEWQPEPPVSAREVAEETAEAMLSRMRNVLRDAQGGSW